MQRKDDKLLSVLSLNGIKCVVGEVESGELI